MNESFEHRLVEFYDAVLENDGMKVQKLLSKDSYIDFTAKERILTGILVIAIEKRLHHSVQSILAYNSFFNQKISNKHLDAITNFSKKNNLNAQLDIVYN